MQEEQNNNPELLEQKGTLPIQGLQARRAPNFATVYANNVAAVVSPWDFSVTFGQLITDDLANPYVEQRVSLTLSMQTAKALADILARNLRAYEQKYGEVRYIPLPQKSEEPSA